MPKRIRAPKGTGSLRRRADGTWEKRLSLRRSDGTRYQFSVYGSTAAEAEQKAVTFLLEKSAVPKTSVKLEAHIKAWLKRKKDQCLVGMRAGATYLLYEQITRKHIVPHIGRFELQSISKNTVLQLRDGLIEKGVRPPTVDKALRILKTALYDAVERGLIDENPVARVRLSKVHSKPKNGYAEDEVIRFLNAALMHSRYYALYLLALCAGLRQGELFGLDWKDINLNTGSIYVRRALRFDSEGKLEIGPPKMGSTGVVIIPPEAMEALRDMPGPHVGLVFTAPGGGYLRKEILEARVSPVAEESRVAEDHFSRTASQRQQSFTKCWGEFVSTERTWKMEILAHAS